MTKNHGEKNNHKRALLVFGLLVMGGLLLVTSKKLPPQNRASAGTETEDSTRSTASMVAALQKTPNGQVANYATPEEDVAARLQAFTTNRRELASRFAEKLGIKLPTEVNGFFDAAEKGDFAALQTLWDQMDFKNEDLRKMRVVLQETFGVHEQVKTWPAQALLDYGARILGDVESGSVYFGGTDAGRFIPTLLNETAPGSGRIILTQNALADSSYLEYVNFLYDGRFTPFSSENSQSAFSDYLQDAKRRMEHDKNFPKEPKQVRVGENLAQADGRIQLSGQGAVMAINERLVQMFREANPELTVSFEESYSLPSTYAGAVPNGMLISLRPGTATPSISPELANQTMSGWRESANQWLNTPAFQTTPEIGKSYAQMLVAHGNLFQSQNLFSQAEQAYRLAQQITPTSPLPLNQLAALLNATGRSNEAVVVTDAANRLR